MTQVDPSGHICRWGESMSVTQSDRQVADQAGSELSSVAEFRWDLVTDAWWWSAALYRLFGYEPGTVQPTMERFLRHKDPQDAARIDEVFGRSRSHGGPFSCYHHIIDTLGQKKTVVAVGYGERSSSGSVTVLMRGFLVDVTDSGRQETNAALQASFASRAAIEQVKGALMLVYGIRADAAFEVLRSHSQVYNVKVSTLVASVLTMFTRRSSSAGITRGEVDKMLWDAAHQP